MTSPEHPALARSLVGETFAADRHDVVSREYPPPEGPWLCQARRESRNEVGLEPATALIAAQEVAAQTS